jgi:hypothetical protein
MSSRSKRLASIGEISVASPVSVALRTWRVSRVRDSDCAPAFPANNNAAANAIQRTLQIKGFSCGDVQQPYGVVHSTSNTRMNAKHPMRQWSAENSAGQKPRTAHGVEPHGVKPHGVKPQGV